MKQLHFKPYLITAILLLGVHTNAMADILIIGHKSLPIKKLSHSQVKRIFLGKVSSINNHRIKVVEQVATSESRQKFIRLALNMTEPQMKSYWARIIFSGKGLPPKIKKTDKQVKNLIKENKNMIGYIQNKNLDDNFKVLLVLK